MCLWSLLCCLLGQDLLLCWPYLQIEAWQGCLKSQSSGCCVGTMVKIEKKWMLCDWQELQYLSHLAQTACWERVSDLACFSAACLKVQSTKNIKWNSFTIKSDKNYWNTLKWQDENERCLLPYLKTNINKLSFIPLIMNLYTTSPHLFYIIQDVLIHPTHSGINR